jgi:hypothetical protein
MNRNRLLYFIFIVITIITGLASRHFSALLPNWIKLYLGDSLWALMVFLMAGFIFSKKTSFWTAIIALAFSYCIEISQLYHATWIDYIRALKLGGLILGFGFLWSDLVCYTIGIGFGYLMEKIFYRKAGN